MSSLPSPAQADRAGRRIPAWQRYAQNLVEARWFHGLIVVVIVANAVVIGVNTFALEHYLARVLTEVDTVFIGIYVVELVFRMAAVGFAPLRFFRNRWNTFDFCVVAATFVPGISTSATALRLLRLLRVSRLLRVMPDVRVLLRGLRRAAPPALSLLALTVLLCYLYGVVGCMLFGGRTPEGMRGYFDNLGEAMLTLFELLTLEGWNSVAHDLRQVSHWALPYVISFLLIGTYVVVNLVVGIVITSLDEAYKEQARERQREMLADTSQTETIAQTVGQLRELLVRLEVQLEEPHRPPA